MSLETDGCGEKNANAQGAGDIGFSWTDFNCPYDSGCPIDYIWWWDLRGFANEGIWESNEYIYGKLHLSQAKVEWTAAGCTTDADCIDPSKPKCNTAKGECVECLNNDITYNDANTNNDRSSQCPSSKPWCNLNTFTCDVPAPCNINADCPSGQCCSYEIDTSKQGKCENVGTLSQPYLCACSIFKSLTT